MDTNNRPPVIQYQTRYGAMVALAADYYIGRSLSFYGEYSENEVYLFRQLIKPGMVVVDAGANIGSLTLPLAYMVGDTGRVYAFEPHPVTFSLLHANMVANQLKNALGFNVALGSAPGKAFMPVLGLDSDNTNYGGMEIGSGEVEVAVTTLDSFLLPRVDFIKVDVEGCELDVLVGAGETIDRARPILYVENDRKEKSPALISHIQGRGYRLFWHTPALFNEDNFNRETENLWPGVGSCNMLCIPAEITMDLKGFTEIATPDDWILE